MPIALELIAVSKTFTMHLQGGLRLPVIAGVTFSVRAGECTVLAGRSGVGKSSVLKMIFGSYRCDAGQILLHNGGQRTDVANAPPRRMLALRRSTIGYVSQFLRAVPRVGAIDVVAEPLLGNGASREDARSRAGDLLRRLNIPESLLSLPPATFSGGEQQRVNIARGFLPQLPVLLLDEPTASLDAANCAIVTSLIVEKKKQGTAIVAVVHDQSVRDRIADSVVDLTNFAAAA
ncbi:MAG TPA: phosphonate C-P lyase system protein PhnL [Pseudomonadota bacterium]|nr:phosphonate C-P lyase system protein PhnL [Pseudomonadota bacterium]